MKEVILKTYSAKPGEVEREWYVVDLEGKTLGRVASQIAMVLRGKNKPTFTPHVDTGDFVVAVNADKIRVTGNKLIQKKYYHYTGYMGGLKEISLEKLLQKDPGAVIKHAVRGMLPKGILGRKQLKKLRVFAGSEHPHQAQQPKVLELND